MISVCGYHTTLEKERKGGGDAFAPFFRRTSYVPFLQGRALQTIFFADKMRLKMLQNNSASHVKTSAYGEHDGKTAFSFNFL